MGQFATPSPLSRHIFEYLSHEYGLQNVRFLEPALGSGSFYSALLSTLGTEKIQEAVGVELDSRFAEVSRDLWAGTPLEVVNEDFTRYQSERQFDLLVTNPPYVRHHNLSGEDKARLCREARRDLNIDVSALAGLYCHFIFQAHKFLAPGAVSAWLIPSEFMDVNYGGAVKNYLLRHVTLDRIHRFEPEDMQFADALVSSAIVFFRNIAPESAKKVAMTLGGTLDKPHYSVDVSTEVLSATRKWTRFPVHGESEEIEERHRLGSYFNVKRGLATGHNGFFIMPRAKAAHLGLPEDYLRPVLPSARNLPSDVVEADSEGYPTNADQLVMLDCPLPAEHVQQQFPDLWRYLQEGIEQGIAEGYLASSRKPWYSQEQRGPAPIICTYMGRSKTGVAPFRFIRNRSRATATNVFLMLYPKPEVRDRLAEHPEILDEVHKELMATASKAFTTEGRVYGGGLYKMEPSELARLPVSERVAAMLENQLGLGL